MTNKTKQVMIADYFPGMGLPGRDGEDGADAPMGMNTAPPRPGFITTIHSQTLTAAVFIQPVLFSVTDIGGFFSTGTARWTPPAGWVMLTHTVAPSNASLNGFVATVIYKNGVNFHEQDTIASASNVTSSDTMSHAVTLDYANGTDYYQWYCYVTTGGPAVALNANPYSQWRGVWLGP